MQTRTFDDKAFMSDPNKWPCWPFLPVKRYTAQAGPGPVCGLILAVEGQMTTVYFASMFRTEGRVGELTTDFIKNEAIKRTVYEDIDKLLADGWIVD